MRLYINDVMALPVLGELSLRKTRSEAAASLSAVILAAPADTYFQKLSIALGDPVRLAEEDGTAVFLGSVRKLERRPEKTALTACDRGILLTRNELRGAYIGTPEDVVRQVAGELGLPLGTVEAGTGRRCVVPGPGRSAFSILREAVGGGREISLRDGALTVTESARTVCPLPPSQVLEVRGSASLEGMVNRCVTVGRNGRVLDRAENAGDIRAYGPAQAVRLGQRDKPAAAFLSGRRFAGSVTVLGNLAYRCGAAVELHRPDWGLDGVYAVTASEHRWKAGLFTTTMELEWIR